MAYRLINTALPLLPGEPHSSPQHNRGVQLPLRGHVCGDEAAESHRGEVPFVIHSLYLLTNNVASQWKKALSVGDWAAGGVGRWELGLSSVHRNLGHSFILTPISLGESEDSRVTRQ